MNQTRSFLLIAWLVVASLLWMEWNKSPEAGAQATAATANALPVANASPPNTLPGATLPAAGVGVSALPGPAAKDQRSDSASQPITLANDVLKLTVDLHGGRLIDSQLLQYTEEKKPGSPYVRLLSSAPALYYVADAGLISVDGKNPQRELSAQFRTESGSNDYVLAPGTAAISVPLLWTDPASGLRVRRTLTLKRYSYVLEVSDQISNSGASAQRLYPYVALSRVAPPAPPKHSLMTNPETFSFVGAAWYTPEDKYQKAKLSSFDGKKPPTSEVSGGWIGLLQHHFASAWVPLENERQARVETSIGSHDGVPLYSIRSIGAALDVAPGATSSAAPMLRIEYSGTPSWLAMLVSTRACRSLSSGTQALAK